MSAEASSMSCGSYCDVAIPLPGIIVCGLAFDQCSHLDPPGWQRHTSMPEIQPLASLAISTFCISELVAVQGVRLSWGHRMPHHVQQNHGQGAKSIPDTDGKGVIEACFPALDFWVRLDPSAHEPFTVELYRKEMVKMPGFGSDRLLSNRKRKLFVPLSGVCVSLSPWPCWLPGIEQSTGISHPGACQHHLHTILWTQAFSSCHRAWQMWWGCNKSV